MSVAVVWQLEPEVDWPGHTHNTTYILFSMKIWLTKDFIQNIATSTALPQQYQNAHNDIIAIHYTPNVTTQLTICVQHHLNIFTNLLKDSSSSEIVPTIATSTDGAVIYRGMWQRSKVTNSRDIPTTPTVPMSKPLFQKAK